MNKLISRFSPTFQIPTILIFCLLIISHVSAQQIFPLLENNSRLFFNFFIIIALSVMGFYNLVIYVMRRKDCAPLYLGIFCLLISVNNFVSDGSTAYLLAPVSRLHSLLLQKIDIVTVMSSTPFFIMFLHAFFPVLRNSKVLRSVQIITVAFIFVIIFISSRTLEITFICFFPVILMMIVYSLVISIRATVLRLNDAPGIFLGIIILSIAGINDVLWGMKIIQTVIWMPFATFAFTFIYSVLISRRFSNALTSAERLAAELIKNQQLREEMQRRQVQEQYLRQTQHRLTGMLHSVEVPLCAVDDTGIIIFCNRAFEIMTGKSLEYMSGKSYSLFIDIKDRKNEFITAPLELEDEQLGILVFESNRSGMPGNHSAVILVEELNRNRERIRSLEELLMKTDPALLKNNSRLGHDLEMIDTALEQMSHVLINDKEKEIMKRVALELVTQSISYWTECTKKTKFELAEESNLWKVHMNPDGWKRTQTLDRYLDPKTFPQNPRWNQVIKTADFVLIQCKQPSELRNQLELSLQKLLILLRPM